MYYWDHNHPEGRIIPTASALVNTSLRVFPYLFVENISQEWAYCLPHISIIIETPKNKFSATNKKLFSRNLGCTLPLFLFYPLNTLHSLFLPHVATHSWITWVNHTNSISFHSVTYTIIVCASIIRRISGFLIFCFSILSLVNTADRAVVSLVTEHTKKAIAEPLGEKENEVPTLYNTYLTWSQICESDVDCQEENLWTAYWVRKNKQLNQSRQWKVATITVWVLRRLANVCTS